MTQALISTETIERSILVIRGHRVMLDSDLAKLYGVENRALIQAVKRNLDLFPDDFMFQLTDEEAESLRSQTVISNEPGTGLRSQTVTSNKGRGGRRFNPYAFTEQGVAMLSGVLKSDRAKRVNIEIMRAFVRFRHILASHQELIMRLDAMEAHYDKQFAVVFDALRQLMQPPERPTRQIGFRTEE